MKQVGYVHIEVEKDERTYTFKMPMGAPLSDASEVSFQIFKACDKMYREAIDKEVKEREESTKDSKEKTDPK